MASFACGTRDRPNPAPIPASLWLATTTQTQVGAPPPINGGAPTRIYISAHPALQTKKRTSRAMFVQQRYPRTWAGVWGNIDREFRTQRRPLNVASVLRRTVRAGDVAPYARPGPPGSRQLDDRCKTFHQLFGLAGFFELDLDHVSGDRDHGTGAKGLVAHGIARGKVL